MHGPINVKSPNNINKWQMGFNLAFKELKGGSIKGRLNEDSQATCMLLHFDIVDEYAA